MLYSLQTKLPLRVLTNCQNSLLTGISNMSSGPSRKGKVSKKTKCVLIDISGTLHVENSPTPGAVEALERLRQTNVKIRFLTNTTKESTSCLYNRLVSLGFKLSREEIFSSLSAAETLLKKNKWKPFLIIAPEAMEHFADVALKKDQTPDAVLVGLAPTEFYYEKLNEAFNYLIKGIPLLALHAGRYYKTSSGLDLGPGCFVKGLEYCANCKAEIIGKPSKDFFKLALGKTFPDDTVMIGDDVYDDINGAMAAGIKGYLVRTGKYREDDENKMDQSPARVVDTFSDAVDSIIKDISKV